MAGDFRVAGGVAKGRLLGLQGCEAMIPVRADRNVAAARCENTEDSSGKTLVFRMVTGWMVTPDE